MRIKKFDDFGKLNEQIQKKISKVVNWVGNLIDQYDGQNIKTQIIFVAGLDNRKNDWSLEKQIMALQKFIPNAKIKGFCSTRGCDRQGHSPKDASMKELIKNPNSIVVLFSNGTQFSNKASNLISDKQNLFILEPYPQAASLVQSAVQNGVPSSNVITGGSGRGQGILGGMGKTTKTPSQYGHFPSLFYMSQILRDKYGF